MKRDVDPDTGTYYLSPPTRGRGLKPKYMAKVERNGGVAPHAGAWIETGARGGVRLSGRVAPHAGAWIET